MQPGARGVAAWGTWGCTVGALAQPPVKVNQVPGLEGHCGGLVRVRVRVRVRGSPNQHPALEDRWPDDYPYPYPYP